MTEELRTYLGQPVEPHEVSGVEVIQVCCEQCGQIVQSDDGTGWRHEDSRYDLPEDES